MLRSLFSGISGLRAHQQMMDVTGNNIANVNTTGYKSAQTTFQDTLSQYVQAAGAPQDSIGGTNPAQIGLGVKLGSISTNFAQGAAQTTNRSTDLMIQGDGLFVLRDVNETLFTRAGNFSFDSEGTLTAGGGKVVQGWTGIGGVINTNGATTDIRLPAGALLPATPTTKVVMNGNLPADTLSPDPIQRSITGYDGQGNKVPVEVAYTKITPTQWTVTASHAGTTSATYTVNFDADGSNPQLVGGDTATSFVHDGIQLSMAGITSYAGAVSVQAVSQNGAEMGALQGFSISPAGTLIGFFSNGLKQPLGQLALANFNNPVGLEKVGQSMFRTTANSGIPQVGTPGLAGLGTLQTGTLEMSNVDLAQEFTNLVIAQRGFQANSRVITTSDELLNDLVNLKR
jgi:flagellar hook protein FlgE